MKKFAVIALLIAAIMFSACNNASVTRKNDVSFSVSNNTYTESSSIVEDTVEVEATTSKSLNSENSTAKQKKTCAATTTTQKNKNETTTTKPPPKSTTKNHSTTARKTKTTTKKATTTTKKQTTIKAATCTNNGNHRQSCGNMGRWFNSRNEVKAFVDKEMKYWADLEESGQITREEYYKKCPSGYECWSCAYCGKWTGNFKY